MFDMDSPETAGSHKEEEVLSGGNMGGAVRVGETVRRPAGAWTPTIQRFLGHLGKQGLAWVPKPLGRDDRGRDRLSFLPGAVPQYPLPDWIWDDDVLAKAGQLLAQLHEASGSFDARGAVWQLPHHEPAEVICHNDFAPYNMVFIDQRLSGVIDWDTASPGPRLWDLAYLAYRLVPLSGPANADGLTSSPLERARRLRLLCTAYGATVQPTEVVPMAVRRLEDLASFTQERADEGHEQLRSHVALYRRDVHWIRSHVDQLCSSRS
jgi:hypothetical protein